MKSESKSELKSKPYLSRHHSPAGARWALNDQALPESFSLGLLLELPRAAAADLLESLASVRSTPVEGATLAPIDAQQEVWASGVTYLRSREARKAESASSGVYDKVYDAERPELFMKAAGWRAVGDGAPVRIRKDSRWNVPEPELALVVNRHGEILGFTVGNDMSSRDIEGENPLYLPQAKIYNGACALGPGILVAEADALRDLAISLEIRRGGAAAFTGETRTSQMKRSLEDLVHYLLAELAFPQGVLLMTGTGIVPGEDFSLEAGDEVTITVGDLSLTNPVQG